VYAARGGLEDWLAAAQRFHEYGFTNVELTTMGAGFRDLSEHLDALRRFRAGVTELSSSPVRRSS
jgi:hypothetical protein